MPPPSFVVPLHTKEIISRVIGREGGFVNDLADPGGATNFGVTIRTLSNWLDSPATVADVKNLTITVATQIYYQDYWIKANIGNIGNYPLVKEFIFDWVVNSGIKTPCRGLQRLVGTKADGDIGDKTADAINLYFSKYGSARFPEAFGKLIDCRIEFYIRVVKKRTTSLKYLRGWYIRANGFRVYGNNPTGFVA